MKNEVVLQKVAEIRKEMPQTGTVKLWEYLRPELPKVEIKMGRDGLNNLLRDQGLLIRKTKRFHITTDSNHYYYTSPNRIKEIEITHAEQVFVTDITYINTDECHAYLALITDAYSKKIMGWSLEDNMKVSMVKEALTMAHQRTIFKHESIIHHSDRGKQYCCPDYTSFAGNKPKFKNPTQQIEKLNFVVWKQTNTID
jgi:putative transposase